MRLLFVSSVKPKGVYFDLLMHIMYTAYVNVLN